MTKKAINIKPANIIARSQRIAQRLFEGKMLVITPSNSQLHKFNDVGTFIWDLLESPTSLEQICLKIQENYQKFEKDRDFEDLARFLLSLEAKKLITIKRD